MPINLYIGITRKINMMGGGMAFYHKSRYGNFHVQSWQ